MVTMRVMMRVMRGSGAVYISSPYTNRYRYFVGTAYLSMYASSGMYSGSLYICIDT